MEAEFEALLEDEMEIASSDQTSLFVRRLKPEGHPIGRLLWVHGFAEHGGRYIETLRWFAAHGFDSWMVDLRGHGRSGGKRVCINRFSDYLDDMEAFYRFVTQQIDGEVPTFALGHSMGGLVLARLLQDRAVSLLDLTGCVFLSPFLGSEMKLPAWKSFAGRVLSRIIPNFSMPANISTEILSKDPEIGRAYVADSLIPHCATARWFTETLAAQELAFAQAERIKIPALVMHGQADELADIMAASNFFDRLGSENREFKPWENLRHELLNEVERQQVRESIARWIASVLGNE